MNAFKHAHARRSVRWRTNRHLGRRLNINLSLTGAASIGQMFVRDIANPNDDPCANGSAQLRLIDSNRILQPLPWIRMNFGLDHSLPGGYH